MDDSLLHELKEHVSRRTLAKVCCHTLSALSDMDLRSPKSGKTRDQKLKVHTAS